MLLFVQCPLLHRLNLLKKPVSVDSSVKPQVNDNGNSIEDMDFEVDAAKWNKLIKILPARCFRRVKEGWKRWSIQKILPACCRK